MGAKTKPGKVGGREGRVEWVLCPSSGLLHRQEDAAAHSAWLEEPPGGPGPRHPSISGDRLTAGLATVPRASLGLTLPEHVLFSSVFVSPATASALRLGQGAMATLAVPDTLVLRVFVSSALAGRSEVCCVAQSWPHLLHLPPGHLLTLAPLAAPVHLAASVRVRVEGREADTRLRAAAGHHLRELVVPATAEVPLPYYGAEVRLRVEVEAEGGQGDLAADLQLLNISPEPRLPSSPAPHPRLSSPSITSTPVKSRTEEQGRSGGEVQFYCVSLATKVEFEEQVVEEVARPRFLGGLDVELGRVREAVEGVLRGPRVARRLVTGVLLSGPPGTGKTSLATSLPALLGVAMVQVAAPELYSKFLGETEAQLRVKFEEAVAKAPAILFIDELDTVAPRREAGASEQERRVAAALVCLVDKLSRAEERVVVVAATSRLDAVDLALRRPGRLDLEVEVGVPAAAARRAILAGLLAEVEAEVGEDEVLRLARDTHGFVGADLQALVSLARLEAARRGEEVVGVEHLLAVRPRVKPSAMREVLVEVPEVTWADIGGLEELKLKLRQAVEWPVRHPEVFARMGIAAPRGLLMYGPPGCSKTMIAKALANESGLNFLSIKGPELFSKWVGESERAVREVFRRARQVPGLH